MIASREQIKEALREEREQPEHYDGCHEFVIKHQPPDVGREVPVQPGVGKPAKCRARIVDHWPHRDGGHVVRVELLPLEQQPRYIRAASGGGYTTDPNQAMQNEAGVAEWAPPTDWKDPGYGAREAHRRALQSDELERRLAEVTDWDELVRLKQLARALGVDIRSDVRIVEERIEAIETAKEAIGRRVEAIKDKIRERHSQAA